MAENVNGRNNHLYHQLNVSSKLEHLEVTLQRCRI